MGISALIGGVASIGSAIIGGNAADKASQAQAQSQDKAIAAQQDMFKTTQSNLAPYNQFGQNNLGILGAALPGLTQKFDPTIAQLQQTPGYQFTLDQGLKSTQSGYAAQGLGSSGAAIKGAGQYATGLASNTFQQMFGDYWSQNQNIYNMLFGPAGLGENAAAGVGAAATTTGQGIANSLTNQGNNQASGILGSAGAIQGGINGVSSSAMLAAMMHGGGGSGGGSMSGLNSLLGGNSGSNPWLGA